jgi:hypothetical protein
VFLHLTRPTDTLRLPSSTLRYQLFLLLLIYLVLFFLLCFPGFSVVIFSVVSGQSVFLDELFAHVYQLCKTHLCAAALSPQFFSSAA